ncbi:MAG TPA: carboxy-S-adenosyl-L-methionine synthase CmoA [Planctomycetes bacterium]|nr:carboxy-S-adenosyl-L-methionine synthase CmoA [Planctomycetota bacterium]
MSADRIYSLPLNRVGDFEFDDEVADVFPDMIRRSVPGYASMLSMIGQCAETYVLPDTNVYDLGCSLGAATFAVQQNAPSDCRIHAVDSSAAMVTRLRRIVSEQSSEGAAVEVHKTDIREIAVRNASLVVLNLTLQFLPPEERDSFVHGVAAGILPGGAMLLSEKISFVDAAENRLMTRLHHDFKRAHGYSHLEIAQKRTAIENRLVPETLETHIERLRRAGFSTICPWFQCFNFASVLAVK